MPPQIILIINFNFLSIWPKNLQPYRTLHLNQNPQHDLKIPIFYLLIQIIDFITIFLLHKVLFVSDFQRRINNQPHVLIINKPMIPFFGPVFLSVDAESSDDGHVADHRVFEHGFALDSRVVVRDAEAVGELGEIRDLGEQK